jgi:hypothetical protein
VYTVSFAVNVVDPAPVVFDGTAPTIVTDVPGDPVNP